MTNLAIKAILGVKAMSEISSALGEDDDAKKYKVSGNAYFEGLS